MLRGMCISVPLLLSEVQIIDLPIKVAGGVSVSTSSGWSLVVLAGLSVVTLVGAADTRGKTTTREIINQ